MWSTCKISTLYKLNTEYPNCMTNIKKISTLYDLNQSIQISQNYHHHWVRRNVQFVIFNINWFNECHIEMFFMKLFSQDVWNCILILHNSFLNCIMYLRSCSSAYRNKKDPHIFTELIYIPCVYVWLLRCFYVFLVYI